MAITDVWQDVWGDVWQDVWGDAAVAFTGPLSIDGTEVKVIQGSHAEEGAPLVSDDWSQAGERRSPRSYIRGRNRVKRWGPFLTPDMDVTAALEPYGQRTANGYLVGGSAVQVYVRDLERVWGSTTLRFALRFALDEAVP
jgi:hypothetical protein